MGANSGSGDAGAAGLTPTGALRVFIVDDEAPIRSALIRYFARQGWQAEGMGDAAAALAHLRGAAEGRYDVILTDLTMPGLDGAAFHDALREARPDFFDRLILASGDLRSVQAVELQERSPRPLISKPFEFGALLALIRRVATGER